MPADFSGTWTNTKMEGWADLLEALKVDKSKVPADLKVTEAITQSGDTITIVTTNNKDPSARKEVTITVGSNFTETLVGQPFECTTAWESDKLVLTGVGGKGKSTRELVGGQMLVTIQIGSAVAKTWFSKQ
ncbi:uncharacterized protein LOC110977657 [Acanthaster planci]|uniref:Uncharacterized protein LOC110977657 n=1 Tax=Acanthaster planci TaxID=133434 RepID=A0A8B7Y789_ACAPL|nr:uncharacterized protein LOC110977657 [Acanthaster planci]